VPGNPGSNSLPNSGAAYVFVRNGSAWTQQAYLKASKRRRRRPLRHRGRDLGRHDRGRRPERVGERFGAGRQFRAQRRRGLRVRAHRHDVDGDRLPEGVQRGERRRVRLTGSGSKATRSSSERPGRTGTAPRPRTTAWASPARPTCSCAAGRPGSSRRT
jgi:hypothetical protein